MARPSKGVSEKYIGVRVPEAYYQSLIKEAENTGRTLAEVVREYLGTFVIPNIADEIYFPVRNLIEAGDALEELRQIEMELSAMADGFERQSLDYRNKLEVVRESIKKIDEFVRKEVKKF
jgi:predicted DNA-binding protein